MVEASSIGGCAIRCRQTMLATPHEFACRKPMSAIGSEFRYGAFFKDAAFSLRQHIAPAAVDALMDEGLRSAFPKRSSRWHARACICLHMVERTMC